MNDTLQQLTTEPNLIIAALVVLAVLLGRLLTNAQPKAYDPKPMDETTRARLLGAVTRAYYDGIE